MMARRKSLRAMGEGHPAGQREATGTGVPIQVFTGLKARTLSNSDWDSKPSVAGGRSQ